MLCSQEDEKFQQNCFVSSEGAADSPKVQTGGSKDGSVAVELFILDTEDDVGEAVLQTQTLERSVDLL